jgi:hypothetical protein
MRESSPRAGPGYARARRCVGPGSETGSAFAPVTVEETSLRCLCRPAGAPRQAESWVDIKPVPDQTKGPVPKRFSIQNFALPEVVQILNSD